ncbi:MAG TPA: DNA repair protein RecO [Pararhizobium sp.]|nr:DNA repair protein RecO [Pararhizobium sp.]
MQWQDQAIILGVKRHGETSVIAELMTHAHGRHMGLVRGGRSRRLQPLLQPGNRVEATWRARLDEHLGTLQVEPLALRAARLMEQAASIHAVQAMAALIRLLPERDPHPHLYEALDVILDSVNDPADAGELFVRFELAILDDLGFGLDLNECAATGTRTDLVFVSPKTGRAVSRSAGEPYAERLLPLPSFLSAERSDAADRESLERAFRLTGYFLARHVYEPRGLPTPISREAFIRAALAALPPSPRVGEGGAEGDG